MPPDKPRPIAANILTLYQWGKHTDWGYVNPDFRNIRQVLHHIETTKARVVIILPVWTHKVWYTKALKHSQKHMFLGCPPDIYLPEDRGASRIEGSPPWDTIALLLDYRHAI